MAKGTLTFESTEKFAAGDHGKFRVTKKKDSAEYDVEVGITYLRKDGLRAIEVSGGVSSALYEIELYVLLITPGKFWRVVQRSVKLSSRSVKQLIYA